MQLLNHIHYMITVHMLKSQAVCNCMVAVPATRKLYLTRIRPVKPHKGKALQGKDTYRY